MQHGDRPLQSEGQLKPLLTMVTENPVWDVPPPTFTRGGGGCGGAAAAVFRKQDPMERDGVLGHDWGSVRGE